MSLLVDRAVVALAGFVAFHAAACGGSGGSGDAGSTGGSDAGTRDGTTGNTCALTKSCSAADESCLGLVDNAGKTTFGLRMSELDLSKPAALATGIVAMTVTGSVAVDLPACNLSGTGSLNWLLQFDTAAGTLATGGAKPVSDPTAGYSFDTETVAESGRAFRVEPVIYSTKPDSTGAFSGAASSQTLILPFYVSPATLLFVLPIQKASITMGKLSANHNCIGSYNAAGLDPANNCQPDSTHPLFVTGGSVTGFVALKDADAVVLDELQETLCVVLSGDAKKYGDGASPVTHCKVDSSKNIVFQGDWCSTTNKAAAAGCADAVQFSGKFAASSVHILNAPTEENDAGTDASDAADEENDAETDASDAAAD